MVQKKLKKEALMQIVKSITHGEAKKIIRFIENLAKKDGDAPVAIAVFNAFDQQIAFLAMDGTLPISIDHIATNKAHSSLTFSRDTIEWTNEKGGQKPAHFNLNTGDPRFTTFPGGVIIKIGGEILGSIGVSGRHGTRNDGGHYAKTLQDHELADAGRKHYIVLNNADAR